MPQKNAPNYNNTNPKKGDLNNLTHWIPISLLHLDYKILTKILSNWLKNILPDTILEEQDCFIPKRNIFNNLFLIRDVIKLTKEKNTKFYVLQIDQEKAFNKTDHEFLYKTLEKMGYSNTFINFTQILYNHNTSAITNNDFLSSPVHLQIG